MSLTLGIDIGSTTAKVVLMNGVKTISKSMSGIIQKCVKKP